MHSEPSRWPDLCRDLDMRLTCSPYLRTCRSSTTSGRRAAGPCAAADGRGRGAPSASYPGPGTARSQVGSAAEVGARRAVGNTAAAAGDDKLELRGGSAAVPTVHSLALLRIRRLHPGCSALLSASGSSAPAAAQLAIDSPDSGNDRAMAAVRRSPSAAGRTAASGRQRQQSTAAGPHPARRRSGHCYCCFEVGLLSTWWMRKVRTVGGRLTSPIVSGVR